MTVAELTETERRLVHLLRAVGYGTMVVTIVAGEPRECEVIPRVRLDKPVWTGVLDLLNDRSLTPSKN